MIFSSKITTEKQQYIKEENQPEKDYYFKVENLTATCNLRTHIPIDKLFVNIKTASFAQNQTSIEFKLVKPKCRVTVAASGIVTLLGIKGLQEIEDALNIIYSILEELEVHCSPQSFNVYQTLCSGYFTFKINLYKLYSMLPGSHYDNEIFPNLQYKNDDKELPFHITLSNNGSFVVNGLQSISDVEKAILQIRQYCVQCKIEDKSE